MLPFYLLLLVSMPIPANAQGWPTPKDPVTRVIVDKSERKMDLWKGQLKIRSYKISLGGDPVGHKQREGDGRTPEGVYTLDYRKTDSVAYKSIHISYPSAQDAAAARERGVKPGGAIMIHGSWNGYGWAGDIMKFFDWTNGCIGITNQEMDEIWDLLAWNTTIEIRP
ncbi:MAG: L,D-transpeptidase family protein [Rhizobiaceae bacterium]